MFFRRAFANKQHNMRNKKDYCNNETFDETSSNESADYKHWQMKVQQQRLQEQLRSEYNNHSVHHNQINYAPHHQTQTQVQHQGNTNINNHHQQNQNGNYQNHFNHQTYVNQSNINPQPPPCSARRGSFGEKEKQLKSSAINCGGGLSVLQLTPIWEHVIRTNALPSSINIDELFEEFHERLFDPEWPVRQHALRVLVDVLIVMGQQADYHIAPILHPIVDNLGHIAPAVRKGSLDALRVYVAQTAMPETVMLQIMHYGMNRPANDPFSGRLTVAIMLALPALILPVLITPKRAYVVKAVMDALSTKMVQITYQEIAIKILLKIKDMVGLNEFNEYMPLNVKKDFELLCKVYGLPKEQNFNDPNVDMHVPAHDPRKPSKFVPKKDLQGNVPSSHAPLDTKYFGGNYDATYPFERTRLSNNLGTPKRERSPRQNSAGILRSSSENNLTVDFNGNSSGSESGGSSMSLQTQTNTAANSKVVSFGNGVNGVGEKSVVNGKVIMETEIKITPETAVTMRILEQNPSIQADDSDEENGTRKIITDISAPYPVTPMKAKNLDESRNVESASSLPRNGRRVRFGGEVIKMRTPDSDIVEHSDDNESKNFPIKIEKDNSDNSSISSDNSTTNEYIKQANVGFINEPLSLNQLRSNIGQLKEKKVDSFVVKSSDALNRATPMIARPVSSSAVIHSPPIKNESSSSTDYSQELNIRIPEVETVLPAHFTPPNIMIKKSPINSNNNLLVKRPATSPMVSPKIITIPPTSSSSQHSSKNNSPVKSAPSTPNYHSPSPYRSRTRSSSPEIRTPIRRSVSSLSPREFVHREVTMMYNLTRSPGTSPAKNRRNSFSADDHSRYEEATQTSIYNPKLDEMTQTPNYSARNDEMTQTSIIGDIKDGGGCVGEDLTPSSVKDSPNLVIFKQPEFKSWEELGIVDYSVIKDLKSGDFRHRSRAICAIEDALRSTDNLAMVQPYLDSLLRSLLASERHPDVMEDQRRVLSNLISRLPLENLEDRVTQIVTGLCRQGGAGSNLVAKNLMQRLPTAAIVLKLLSDDFLSARSSKFRENALQMVIYALVTFPSTYFDISNCVERTTKAALDRKKRVRQAALDVLAVLGQISSPRTVINVVSQIADSRTEGLQLLAAVKARLARKQLPLVSTDGEVQYALRIPSASNVGNTIMFGSDVEWICSGSGSVSPTSIKNRSFKVQEATAVPTGKQPFEERRIVDGLNRYTTAGGAGGGGGINNSSSNKMSPWSRIPVRGGNKEGSSSDDDHGYVAGTAFQGIQKPLESTARFQGKLHSRSFPELSSENVKEKLPVRQMSDNQPSITITKLNGNTKLPVASTKLPNVEINSKCNNQSSSSKNPYSFAPSYKQKSRVIQSSDTVFGESIDSSSAERIILDSRPKTHPTTQQSPTRQKCKQQQKSCDKCDSPRKSSAKVIGNELTIQPLTLTIGLVESDDTASEQNHHNVIKTQPTTTTTTTTTSALNSAKSRCEIINNQDLVENYVEEQTRRTTNSGKTNSHILSDVDNSYNSTPRHEPKPTSTEIANVRSEIAQIQSAIQSVKKEMEEMQKQQSANNTPMHQPSIRPPSSNSNKTFIYDENDGSEIEQPPPATEDSKHIEVTVEHVTSRAPSAKSILKNESPFKRIPTPTPNDVLPDDELSNSPYDSHVQLEDDNEETAEEATHNDEIDHSVEIIDPMIMIRTNSKVSLSKEDEIDTEAEYHEDAVEDVPEIAIMVNRSPHKVVNRPPVLKRNQKTTPVKNPMPNIQQSPTVVIRAPPKPNPLFPPTLRRFERPKDAMNVCLIQLESANWEDVMEGLKNFVRLIRHHPEYIDAQVHLFTLAIAKQVKNLRSQVSRAACSASGEFFLTHSKVLDGDAEELAAALLNRTADTNKFLRADATKALETMTDALHPSKSIMILSFRGATHQNAAVRCTTAKLLNELVFRIGCDKVFNLHREIRDRLILTGANLLMEGSLETRNHTKELFKQLSIHSHYQKLLLDVIPSNIYRNIEKALKSIR